MNKIYFIAGSQTLYGDEVLRQVKNDSEDIANFLSGKITDVSFVSTEVVKSSDDAEKICRAANNDDECIGVITWMHTFSPAKMWIKALKILDKPMLHLHTQHNEKLPYETIDMDFMNLNQSAHGDREFGFICTRLGINREVVAGYYKNENVINKIRRFARVTEAIAFSRKLRVSAFGNNMRDVAVTDGDRVQSEIDFGWNVNYYGIGDLCDIIDTLTDKEIEDKYNEYIEKYTLNTDNIESVRDQAKYEAAIEKFLEKENIGAFTDTFQDLHGLNALPGIAAQNLMAKGIGFGPEGDYKTAALSAVLMKMAKGLDGSTGFAEDYTYDLTYGEEVELASHMLEVSPVFAADKPKIEVHPLSIGGKSDPARLVFEGVTGKGIAVSLIDIGNRFRLICADIELIRQPKEMPNLPTARLMWKIKPDFETGASAWIYAGGAHHAVISTALTPDDIRLFAKLTNTELVEINDKTELSALEHELKLLDLEAKLK